MKHRLQSLLAVSGFAATTFMLGGCGSTTPPATPCDIPKSVHEHSASAKTAPDGGGIRVAEQGFSDSNNTLSIGAVVQNTSDHIAYRTTVAFAPTVSVAGQPPTAQRGMLTTEIPVLLPGTAIGIGRELTFASGKVTAAAVDVRTTTWLDKGALGRTFTTGTTTYLRTIHPNTSQRSVVDIHYAERSTNCRALANRRSAVVFRDAGGKIIGGALADPDQRLTFVDRQGNQVGGEQRPPSSPSCSPGQRETWISPQSGAPPTADDTHTTVYSYCDLNASPSDVNRQF